MPLTEMLLPLLLFVALVLAASLQGLAASGHFPRQAKTSGPDSYVGPAILFGSIALVVVSLGGGIPAAAHLIPWYAAIIGGGSSLLAAPLVLQSFSDRFVDGRSALVVFTAVSLICAMLLIAIAVGR